MQLILHDTLATTVFVEPIRRKWITTDVDVELASDLPGAQVDIGSFALVPSPECTLLADSHEIVPEVAVVARETGAIAMRSPVRADQIEAAKVLLYDVSGAAEILARALLWPFFGITVSGWTSEPASDIGITIVEGALALQEPEAGYCQDLVRSWFVMTGLPVVTHVLLAPVNAADETVETVVAALNDWRQVCHERRPEIRALMDVDRGIERERLVDFLAHQHYRLNDSDREALVALIVKGAGGSAYRPLTRLPFREPDRVDER